VLRRNEKIREIHNASVNLSFPRRRESIHKIIHNPSSMLSCWENLLMDSRLRGNDSGITAKNGMPAPFCKGGDPGASPECPQKTQLCSSKTIFVLEWCNFQITQSLLCRLCHVAKISFIVIKIAFRTSQTCRGGLSSKTL